MRDGNSVARDLHKPSVASLITQINGYPMTFWRLATSSMTTCGNTNLMRLDASHRCRMNGPFC